ncbi:MFS transporter [Paenibacillus selenitireducens]|uniref:MFS transporter n=1 Tax=Paenibacillus selenitireducens TaxID=1324314 RepID=A0A1T2X9Z9_9BACL|nr:MFS transporter [Paenibacillus selenitireducens]OPA76668.1 MFS transporter [Paenibacillus selenitireducens]
MELAQPVQGKPEATSRLWTKDFILLTLSNLFVYLNLQMITPALPAYVSENFDVSSFTISFVISMFALSAIATRMFAGVMVTRMKRLPLVLGGLLIFMLSTMTYYGVGSIAVIVLIRMVYGVGFGIISTTYGTIASENIPKHRIGEGMGYFGLSSSLSMAIAPMIGLWLLNDYGFGTLIFVATLLVAVVIPITFAIRLKKEQPAKPAGPIKIILMDRNALLPCLLTILLSITYGGLITFITMLGKENHIPNVGWFFLFNALAVLLVRPISGRIYDRKGHGAILPIGALMVVISMVILSFTTSLGILIVSAVCYGIGYGTLLPSLQAWAIQRAKPENRGVANGAFYNSIDFGIALGSMTLGMIALKTSYAMMFRLSSLFMILFIVIYYLSRRRHTQP